MTGLQGTASRKSVRGVFIAIAISATMWATAVASAMMLVG